MQIKIYFTTSKMSPNCKEKLATIKSLLLQMHRQLIAMITILKVPVNVSSQCCQSLINSKQEAST